MQKQGRSLVPETELKTSLYPQIILFVSNEEWQVRFAVFLFMINMIDSSKCIRKIQMPTDLSDTFVIGISATALFDLKEADEFFQTRFAEDRESAIVEYRKHMLEREDDPLEDGTAMPLTVLTS